MATIGAIRNGAALAAGLHSDFESMYRQTYDNVLQGIGDIMDLTRSTDLLTTTFAHRQTAPYPRRRPKGAAPFIEGMDAVAASVTAYDYNATVSWHRNDRMDNQIGDIRTDAMQAGAHFASIPSFVAVEFMTATADLLPAIPNCPDGVGLFSATDGASADRFGISGGNLYTGTGTTGAQIRADVFGAIERQATFQNTKGKPFFLPSIQATRYIIYYSATLQENYATAFQADIVQGTSAGISNVARAANLQLDLRPTADITDNDAFIFRTDTPVPPLYMLTREPLRSTESTEENSDEARKTGNEALQFDARMGFGCNVPFGAIKINN